MKKMCTLHPELTERTALNYINQGIRIWNPTNRLDRDFLNTVFLSALLKEIYSTDCDAASRAKNLATLQRYLANMPQDPMDPEMLEKHTINIQLNINGSTITVPADQWAKIKENKLIAAALDRKSPRRRRRRLWRGRTMYLHVFKCNECRYYQTDNCPWQGTKEGNIACKGFASNIVTQSWNGTMPLPNCEPWNSIATTVSTGGPIEVEIG